MIQLTPKGLEELKSLVNCIYEPLALLCPSPRLKIELMDDDSYRNEYYSRAGESLFRGIIFAKIFPEVTTFIDKDAGRIMLLRLYQLAYEDPQNPQSTIRHYQNRLSRELMASRTHIRRMIKSGCETGYFEEDSAGTLILLPPFFHLVESYVAFYFSWNLYFSNVEP